MIAHKFFDDHKEFYDAMTKIQLMSDHKEFYDHSYEQKFSL